jgi:three-Cys-motif partner protein
MALIANGRVTPNAFDWNGWTNGILPSIEEHSEKKLQLLRDYLILYLKILCQKNLGRRTFPITIIDGFAGGGVYSGGKDGSPLVLLRAIQEAEFEINRGRQLHLKIEATFYFVEENKDAFHCLTEQIKNSPYKTSMGVSTFLFHGRFDDHVNGIVDDIKRRHPRGGGRSIFFLDQCGYAKVLPKTVHKIHTELSHKAEFIINFAIDWLADFLNDSSDFRKIIDQFELGSLINVEELLSIKARLSDWRYLVESKFGNAFRTASGLPYFSPFYIEPADNHRGYWLLHLAPVPRARFAMTEIHWQNANGSKHYGPRGLDILGYKPTEDTSLYLKGMSFDEQTREQCQELLASDLAGLMRNRFGNGTTVQALGVHCCNDTIADTAMLKAALASLASREEIRIFSPNGNGKRSKTISDTDIIHPIQQFTLNFGTSGS